MCYRWPFTVAATNYNDDETARLIQTIMIFKFLLAGRTIFEPLREEMQSGARFDGANGKARCVHAQA